MGWSSPATGITGLHPDRATGHRRGPCGRRAGAGGRDHHRSAGWRWHLSAADPGHSSCRCPSMARPTPRCSRRSWVPRPRSSHSCSPQPVPARFARLRIDSRGGLRRARWTSGSGRSSRRPARHPRSTAPFDIADVAPGRASRGPSLPSSRTRPRVLWAPSTEPPAAGARGGQAPGAGHRVRGRPGRPDHRASLAGPGRLGPGRPGSPTVEVSVALDSPLGPVARPGDLGPRPGGRRHGRAIRPPGAHLGALRAPERSRAPPTRFGYWELPGKVTVLERPPTMTTAPSWANGVGRARAASASCSCRRSSRQPRRTSMSATRRTTRRRSRRTRSAEVMSRGPWTPTGTS